MDGLKVRIVNGMVERLHRQLKAAIKTYPNPEHLIKSLSMVLLEVRTALKEDLHCTATEPMCMGLHPAAYLGEFILDPIE